MSLSISMITVEDLCKKLRPIFGKKIDRLYTQYVLTESREKRQEIEQALNALFQKHISPSLLNDQVLLEPPAKEVISGEYPLGIVTYANRDLFTFGLREKEWIRHMCISGMSGSGKTNFAFQIIGNLINKKKPFIVFDWKKSFRPLLKVDKNILLFSVGNSNVSNYFKFNVNRPPKNVGAREWLSFLADLISESFNTSFGVHKILVEVLDKAFQDFGVYEGSNNYPTWHQIRDRLSKKEEELKNSKGRESEWLTSAQRIAYALTFGSFGETVNYKGHDAVDVEDIFDKKVIFELHALNNTEKKFFCEFVLAYIYKYKKVNDTDTEDFKYAIVVDEAHNIFLKDKPNFIKESVTDMIYREIREYGISLICLDQHISKLSDTVAGNSACNIAFQQILPFDLDCVSGLMGIKRDNKNYFSMLPVGHAIVRLAERFLTPFTIKVPLVRLKDEKVSDAAIAEKMKKFAEHNKRVNDVKYDMDTYRVKKMVEKAVRMDVAFKSAGVNPPEDFIARQVRIKEAMEKAYLKEKKPALNNHLQRKIADELKELLNSHNDLRTVKEYLRTQGFKISDINKAIKYVFELNRASKNVTTVEKGKQKDLKRTKVIGITEQDKEFLNYIYNFPDKPTTEVYKALKLSARKGNEIRKNLFELGLIKVKEERNDKGWIKHIQLTQKVIDFFKCPDIEKGLVIY